MTQLTKPQLPFWLKSANKIVMFLNKNGLAVGTQHILTTKGRKSVKPRSTPVSVLTVEGVRYICTLVGDTNWVQNARVNPEAILQRGRKKEEVRLTEVDGNKRSVVMQEFPLQVPMGKLLLKMTLGISGTPESIKKVVDKCRVFKIN